MPVKRGRGRVRRLCSQRGELSQRKTSTLRAGLKLSSVREAGEQWAANQQTSHEPLAVR